MNQIDHLARWIRQFKTGILCCGIVLVSGCAPDSDRPLGEPQSAERGVQVFDYNCGYCHGAKGRGPSLDELKSLSGTERRGKIINHPISGQIPQRLPANELADLIKYLESEG